jgi:hypothetical protein
MTDSWDVVDCHTTDSTASLVSTVERAGATSDGQGCPTFHSLPIKRLTSQAWPIEVKTPRQGISPHFLSIFRRELWVLGPN